MKKIMRIIALCLCLLIGSTIFSPIIPSDLFNIGIVAEAAASLDESTFCPRLELLRQQFKNGEYWTDTYYDPSNPKVKLSYPDLVGSQDTWFTSLASSSSPAHYNELLICLKDGKSCGFCGAYVTDGSVMSVECMGYADLLQTLTFQTLSRNNLITVTDGTICAGDRVNFGGHYVFVTKVVGDTAYFTDCNWDWYCGIRWDQTFSIKEKKNAGAITEVSRVNTNPGLTGVYEGIKTGIDKLEYSNDTGVLTIEGSVEALSNSSTSIKVNVYLYNEDNSSRLLGCLGEVNSEHKFSGSIYLADKLKSIGLGEKKIRLEYLTDSEQGWFVDERTINITSYLTAEFSNLRAIPGNSSAAIYFTTNKSDIDYTVQRCDNYISWTDVANVNHTEDGFAEKMSITDGMN